VKKYINTNRINEKSKKDGQVTWCAPANIALVKYWGKRPGQIPENPSFSLTLKNSVTKTQLTWKKKKDFKKKLDLQFNLEGKRNESFEKKVLGHVQLLSEYIPCLFDFSFIVESENNFPHSAGIASSASGFAALALCFCSFENYLRNKNNEDREFFERASFLARMGSGSACRSIFPKMVLWGEYSHIENSSNLKGIPFEDYHPSFSDLRDAILIVDRSKKSVSSSRGHGMMENHPFSSVRYGQAKVNLHNLIEAINKGDLDTFGDIIEHEALTLHGLMMSSNPPFILMNPRSLQLIEKVRTFRSMIKIPLFTTLDAGPNLHLIYPGKYHQLVKEFIERDCIDLLENGQWIDDEMGDGPYKLEGGKNWENL